MKPDPQALIDKITINPHLGINLTQQLTQQLTWLIANGQLPPESRLPSIRPLSQHLSININTVRSAYQQLEISGLVETRQGAGTKVLPYDARRLALIASKVRSHMIGIILPNISNPYYHDFLEGIYEVTDTDRALLLVCNTHEDPMEARRYFAQLAAKNVDGVVISSQDISDLLAPEDNAGEPVSLSIPFVTVDRPDSAGFVVLQDLENAGYQATKHLLEHRHRRIGLIRFDLDTATVMPVIAGYERALREGGLEPDPDLIARVHGFDMMAGAEGGRMLLARAHPPTAIFAIADTLALGAISAIKNVGLQIPQDIALVGFNNIAIAGLVEPPLTTVASPAREMGREAMKILQRLIAGKKPGNRKVVLPISLVIRKSCGAHDVIQ